LGDEVEVRLQLLDFDHKRLHFYQEMYHCAGGYLAASSEQIALHVDMTSRRSAPFPADVTNKLNDVLATHQGLPRSDRIGHIIGIRRN
jgi:acyl-CoA thioester hydrolase